ncbi:hypothetical protein EDB86DRAFT_3081108 [Lactarius hatsudake]|nr:hypothetical protein EDB86DRAFT_3081108 [Lactarius hatsudake]
MEHLFNSSASEHSATPALTAATAAQLQVQVPFPLRASLSMADHGGAELYCSSPCAQTRSKTVAVDSGATGATCSGASGGEWVYVPAPRGSPGSAGALMLAADEGTRLLTHVPVQALAPITTRRPLSG